METVMKGLLPGYRVNEYRLVIVPHRDLWEKMMKIKEAFAAAYLDDSTRLGRPYLTIASFSQYAMMEQRILGRLREVAMGHYPFKVEIKNFGSFPAHTIYFDVVSRVPVQALIKSVRSQAQRIMKLNEEHKPFFPASPHLTLASRLKPWQYEKGWEEFRHRNFSGRFVAASMSVLRRAAGEEKFRAIADFEFQNLPVSIRQGELFNW